MNNHTIASSAHQIDSAGRSELNETPVPSDAERVAAGPAGGCRDRSSGRRQHLIHDNKSAVPCGTKSYDGSSDELSGECTDEGLDGLWKRLGRYAEAHRRALTMAHHVTITKRFGESPDDHRIGERPGRRLMVVE